jgi:tripartite-type tricarboxylate transporter receptor subunit TctC
MRCTSHEGRRMRRSVAALRTVAALTAIAGLLSAAPARAQGTPTAFPAKPIRLIVPYPAGGPTDVVARVVADRIPAVLGQPVIVENRPGGATNVGTEAVARAAPDGYTLLMGSFANALNKALVPSITWDPLADLVGVALISTSPVALAVPPAFPAEDVAGLLALARRDPGKYNYAIGGAGSSSHLAGELLKAMTGVRLEPILYKGGAPAMQALLQGDVQVMFDNVHTVTPLVRAGKVKLLAVSSRRPWPALPGVPPLDATVPGYELVSWYGWLAPAKTPAAIVATLERAVAQAVSAPEVKPRFEALGLAPGGATAAEFDAFYHAETAKWSKVVRDANIRID